MFGGKWTPSLGRVGDSLLLKMYVAVLIIGTCFHFLTNAQKAVFTPYIALSVGSMFLVSLVAMYVFTSDWTIRVLGVFTVILGNALLYYSAGFLGLGLIDRNFHEFNLDYVRAFLVVASPILAYSWYKYFREWLLERRLRRGSSGDTTVA